MITAVLCLFAVSVFAETSQLNSSGVAGVTDQDNPHGDEFEFDGKTYTAVNKKFVKAFVSSLKGEHEAYSKQWFSDQKRFYKGNKSERTAAKKEHKKNLRFIKKYSSSLAFCSLGDLPDGQTWLNDQANVDWLLQGKQVKDCGVYTDDTHPNYFKRTHEYEALMLTELVVAETINQGTKIKTGGWKNAKKKNKNGAWSSDQKAIFDAMPDGTTLAKDQSRNINKPILTAAGRRRALAFSAGFGQPSDGWRIGMTAQIQDGCPSASIGLYEWDNVCGWHGTRRCSWWGCYTSWSYRCGAYGWQHRAGWSKNLCTFCVGWGPVDICGSVSSAASCGASGNLNGGCKDTANRGYNTVHGLDIEIDVTFTSFELWCDHNYDFDVRLGMC